MNALRDVQSYMEFWGWERGGNPGSVKRDIDGKIIASHGGKVWADDVQRACDTIDRLRKRITDGQSKEC